jgi:hypothetical protein
MIAKARALPGGDAPNIAWIVGRVEDVPLVGPFSCALAAESFHWFDWDCLCRSLHGWVPSSRLVLIEDRRELRAPWSDQIASLIDITPIHSRNGFSRDRAESCDRIVRDRPA